jgi:hypothetical protein
VEAYETEIDKEVDKEKKEKNHLESEKNKKIIDDSFCGILDSVRLLIGDSICSQRRWKKPPGKESTDSEKVKFYYDMETTHKELKNENCVKLIKEGVLNKFMGFFPRKYYSEIETALNNSFLFLKDIVLTAFFAGDCLDEMRKCVKSAHCFDILQYFLYEYPLAKTKRLIACTLGIMNMYLPFTPELVIIIPILMTKEDDVISPLFWTMFEISVSTPENIEIFLKYKILDVIYDTVKNSKKFPTLEMMFGLKEMSNACTDDQTYRICENKIFEFFLPHVIKYIELLNPHSTSSSSETVKPSKLPSDFRIDYFSGCVCDLLLNNKQGTAQLISCGLAKQMIILLQEVVSYSFADETKLGEKKMVFNLLRSISRSFFLDCIPYSKNLDYLLDNSLLTMITNLLLLNNNEIREKKEGLNWNSKYFIVRIIFGISLDGSIRSKLGNKNINYEILIKNNVESLVVQLYNSAKECSSSSTKSSSDEYVKWVLQFIPLTICLIHKNESLSFSLRPFLETVKALLTVEGNDTEFPLWCQIALDGLVNIEEK